MEKIKIHVTRAHYQDMECGRHNLGFSGEKVWNDIHARYELIIDEQPKKDQYYHDFTVNFIYASSLKVLKKKGEPLNTFYCAAECDEDIQAFKAECERARILIAMAPFPYGKMELITSASLEEIQEIMRKVPNGQPMLQTLEKRPVSE